MSNVHLAESSSLLSAKWLPGKTNVLVEATGPTKRPNLRSASLTCKTKELCMRQLHVMRRSIGITGWLAVTLRAQITGCDSFSWFPSVVLTELLLSASAKVQEMRRQRRPSVDLKYILGRRETKWIPSGTINYKTDSRSIDWTSQQLELFVSLRKGTLPGCHHKARHKPPGKTESEGNRGASPLERTLELLWQYTRGQQYP